MYAYPIIIKRSRQTISFEETKEIEGDYMTLKDLEFVGDDAFYVHEHEGSGYTISVSRNRSETDEERDSRVAKEERYMAEYSRRHPKTPKTESLVDRLLMG